MNGKCYVNSYKLLELLSDSVSKETDPVERVKLKGLCLVHGWVTPTSAGDKGKQIDHAWVEGGQFIYETSAGQVAFKEIEVFTQEFQAKQRVRYTLAEASSLIKESGIYGPWDDEGRRHRGLPPLTK